MFAIAHMDLPRTTVDGRPSPKASPRTTAYRSSAALLLAFLLFSALYYTSDHHSHSDSLFGGIVLLIPVGFLIFYALTVAVSILLQRIRQRSKVACPECTLQASPNSDYPAADYKLWYIQAPPEYKNAVNCAKGGGLPDVEAPPAYSCSLTSPDVPPPSYASSTKSLS
ncbi:hypothetical protein AAVH_15027 [Aphelenchoides avenae]|nr:hypothetical protein AAVH_15027 [Aphelenchus avenae]